jgi:hypothetical protein
MIEVESSAADAGAVKPKPAIVAIIITENIFGIIALFIIG